ncbi:MAG: adenylate cyclase, partial [Chloroflexi bacterium]|nr:adenylate cyclase [Chloroflexota bacterium]
MDNIKHLWQRLTGRWRKLSITNKFALAFGLLLALIVLVALTGFWALRVVRQQTETAIVTSMKIQQLALEMNGDLQEARRIEKEFFLRQFGSGVANAGQDYVKAHRQQIDKVVANSAQLQELTSNSNVSNALRQSSVGLANYMPLVDIYAANFEDAVDLVTQLEARDTGVLVRLERSATL